jgi:hypothetical protein
MDEVKKSPVGPTGLPQNERQLPYDIQRRLEQNPFYNGRLIDEEPSGDPEVPARTAAEPNTRLKVASGASRNIPHRLGRRHRSVVFVSPTDAVVDDNDNVPSELRDTHFRVRNAGSGTAFFSVWVS